MTFREFEKLPVKPGKQELIRGELIELPPAKRTRNEIAERIFQVLFGLLAQAHRCGEASTLGKAHHEMGYLLRDGSWLQPDVSVTHAGQQADDYYLGSPALAVEIVSNERTADYIDAKIAGYMSEGALEVWVLFPTRRHIWIYKPGGTAVVHTASFTSALLDVSIDPSGFLDDLTPP
jgi:Uma2 family endonuclease